MSGFVVAIDQGTTSTRAILFDADMKVAAIEKDIETFDIHARVSEVLQRLQDLDLAETMARAERALAERDKDGRGRTLEERLERDLQRLREFLARIKRLL